MNETIRTIKSWLEDLGLKLAEHKMELALVTEWWKQKTVEICIRVHTVTSEPSLKYLGTTFDFKLSIKPHLKLTGKKAANISSTQARMLRNIGRRKHSRR